MSVETNKDTLRQLTIGINRGDMDMVNELVSERYVLHSVAGRDIGIEGFRQYFDTIRKIYPDLFLTIEDMVAEGDKIAHRFTWRGRYKAGSRRSPHYGRIVAVKAMAITRFGPDGRIEEEWTLHDRLGLYQQLGVVPPTEELGNNSGNSLR